MNALQHVTQVWLATLRTERILPGLIPTHPQLRFSGLISRLISQTSCGILGTDTDTDSLFWRLAYIRSLRVLYSIQFLA